ncbi:MAG: DivIVA domain-containing protein [Candidatus Aquicultorales bacterium]
MGGEYFKRSLRGYDIYQVDEFVDRRNKEVQDLKVEVEGLKTDFDKLISAFQEPGALKRLGEEMTQAAVNTDEIVKEAEDKAELILAEAAREAERIRAQAEREALIVKEKGERALQLRDRMLNDMKEILYAARETLESSEPFEEPSPPRTDRLKTGTES